MELSRQHWLSPVRWLITTSVICLISLGSVQAKDGWEDQHYYRFSVSAVNTQRQSNTARIELLQDRQVMYTNTSLLDAKHLGVSMQLIPNPISVLTKPPEPQQVILRAYVGGNIIDEMTWQTYRQYRSRILEQYPLEAQAVFEAQQKSWDEFA